MGQARGVEEGLEQWAHTGARVGLALERALWVPRPERGPRPEWTAWAPEPERALERSLCAPGPEWALERTGFPLPKQVNNIQRKLFVSNYYSLSAGA